MITTGASCAVAQQLLNHKSDTPLTETSNDASTGVLQHYEDGITTCIIQLIDNKSNQELVKHSTTSYINSGNSANRQQEMNIEESIRREMKETLNSIIDFLSLNDLDQNDNEKNKRSDIFAYLLYDNTPKCRLRGSKVKVPDEQLPKSLTSSYDSYNTHYSLGYDTHWHSLMERHGYIRNNNYINCLTTTSIHFMPAGDSQQQLLVQYAHAGRNSQDRENNEH